MRIRFANTEHAIILKKGVLSVFQIENQTLFTRICQSLLSYAGQGALEPFTVWDDDLTEVHPEKALMVIPNPLELPWKHRDLLSGAYAQIDQLLNESEEALTSLQKCSNAIASTLLKASHQMLGEYRFDLEWDACTHLKTFGFNVDRTCNTTLLDNLTSFVDLAADSKINKALLFFNLKNYLTKKDLALLCEHAFSCNLRLLTIENRSTASYPDIESKLVIDQDFIEYQVHYQSLRPSLAQEGICPIGFGAVTF